MLFWSGVPNPSRIDYSFFLNELERNNIKRLTVYPTAAEGSFIVAPEKPLSYDILGQKVEPKKSKNGTVERLSERFEVALPNEGEVRRALFERLDSLRRESEKAAANASANSDSASENPPPFVYDVVPSSNSNSLYLLLSFASLALLGAGLYMFLRRSRENMMGGGFLNSFTRSTAKRYEPTDQVITFDHYFEVILHFMAWQLFPSSVLPSLCRRFHNEYGFSREDLWSCLQQTSELSFEQPLAAVSIEAAKRLLSGGMPLGPLPDRSSFRPAHKTEALSLEVPELLRKAKAWVESIEQRTSTQQRH